MCEASRAPDAYEELSAAVARFIAVTQDGSRTPEEDAQSLIRKARIIDAMRMDFAGDAARFSQSGWWEPWGWTSPVSWLTNNCHLTPGEAGGAVCVGENLATLQRTVEKVDAGVIGYSHLVLMARTNTAVTACGATLDEERLLMRAGGHSPHEFRRHCTHARHAADAAAFHRRQQEFADERSLVFKPLGDTDGGFLIEGFMDAVGGAALKAALEPLARRLGPDDDRPRDQRLGDALAEMSFYTLNTGGQGATHCQVPHLQVTATLDTLMATPGAPAGELEGALPISAATVERLACNAGVRRVLLDSQSLVVDVGREKRVPGTATSIKVKNRDQGCVWPRCLRKVRWVEIHHVKHWARERGSTEEDNLVCLCWKHHDDVHLRGWQVVRAPGQREVLAIPPLPQSDPRNRGPSVRHAV